jgi:SAM-dependent methyltransferase
MSTFYWHETQPGLRFATEQPGTVEFFAEVERQRYELEPHIPELAAFESWSDRDVLEVGCGIATDGARFAAAGARYVGVDLSDTALELAGRRFELLELPGSFVRATATELPFDAASFDLVYSHGVLHHVDRTAAAIAEIGRVLRPGGTALVMLYHRRSLNYWLNIMLIRRLLALVLVIPGAAAAIARLTGEDREILDGHRRLLADHGLRYLTDRQLFLSNNTDGPGNPLSKVYSRAEAAALFVGYADVRCEVRNLNLRLFPGGRRLARTALARRAERHLGWHLYIRATMP